MRNRGITLLALIITVIILLILATVSISLIINSGIIDHAQYGVDKYSEEEELEQIKLAVASAMLKGNGFLTTENLNIELQNRIDENEEAEPINDYWKYNGYKITSNGQIEKTLLPKEYQQVEYIESTGTQYIDTLQKISINSQINSKFKFVGDSNNDMTVYGYRCNDNNGNIIDSLSIIPYNSLIYTYYGNNIVNKTYAKDNTLNVASEYIHNKSGVWVNGIKKVSYLNVDVNMNIPSIYLFGRNNNGNVDKQSSVCIYYFQIFEEEQLICNYIPCYRKSDNVIGMYDTVEGKFYVNQGEGTFLKGADV